MVYVFEKHILFLWNIVSNMIIKTITLDHLCEILDCEVEDICRHIKDKSDES